MRHLPRISFVVIPLLCGAGVLQPATSHAYDARSLASVDANLVLLDVIADRLDNAAGRGAAWAQVLSAEHEREPDAGQLAYRHEMHGISAGYDAMSGRIWRFGVAAARVNHDAVASPALGAPDLGQIALSAYAGGGFGRVSISGGVMLSRWQDVATGIGNAADADATARGFFLAAAYDLGAQNAWRARVETRATRIKALGDDFQRASGGMAFMRPHTLRRGGTLTPWVRGGVQWQGDARDIVKGYAAVGASWEPTERTAFTVAYEAQQAGLAQGHIAQIGFSIGL